MAVSHAAAAWSVDSLPEYYSSIGQGDQSIEQELVLDCISELSELSQELCIIVTTRAINLADLRRKHFVAVKSILNYAREDLQTHTCPSQARALLVMQVGLSINKVTMQGITALSQNASAPAILVILITDAEEEDDGTTLPQELAQTRASLLESGADDVISVGTGVPLSGHHILEAINRVEIQAQKMSELEMEASDIQEQATNEVNATKEMLQRKLQVAWKKMMWHLPGRLLESIPGEDGSLQEHIGQDGHCTGVGLYTCDEQIGRGLYGTVFKAHDAEGQLVALKVIHKGNLKKVSQLLSLEQELCLMQHLPPHPNVTRAREAMHGLKNLYLVMEFSGSVNLHKFIQNRIARTGASALEADLANMFMPQMAKAVAHLHSLAVCHRDLKPGHFIVSNDAQRLSLVDFGLAAMLCSPTQRLTQCCGSLPFIAPEVLQQQAGGQSYDPFAADIWSLGMNFVEIRKGPFIIEKIIGWVPQHPSDPERRIEGVQRFPSLFASLPDSGMMNGTVSLMLQLRPEDRITITEVLGRSGLGYETTVPTTHQRSGSKVPMRGAGALALAPPPVCVRAVDCDDQALHRGTLLDRLGGETVVRVAVDNMFDLAMTNTPLSLLLDVCRGGMPAVRSLYCDEVTEFFDCDRGSTRAEGALARMRSADMHLTMSDSDFDVLAEHFSTVLGVSGADEPIVHQARTRFGELREAVTANYHMGAAHARLVGTSQWRAAAAAAENSGRARCFAEALVRLLVQPSGLGAGAPAALQNVETVLSHFRGYLGGQPGFKSPVPLQGVSLSLANVAVVVNTSRTALVEAGFQPEEVCVLYFALRRAFDQVRLARRLRKVHSASLHSDAASWTAIVLNVQQAAQHYTGLVEVARSVDFIPFLAIVGSILSTGALEDHEDRLSSLGHSIGMTNASYDAFVELFRNVCTSFLPKLDAQVSMVVSALRHWVLLQHNLATFEPGIAVGSAS